MTLTARQQAIFDFIQQQLNDRGLPPTRAEIVTAFGFASPNAAQCHLRALADKGMIELRRGTARGIVPIGTAGRSAGRSRVPGALTLPVVGRVQAGRPILAIEHHETDLRIDRSLFSPRPDYLLRVQGNSMTGAGIQDGDLLAVHRSPEARSGQIVVARIDDEVTVKRLKRHGRGWQLLAEHPEHPAIEVKSDQALTIEGLAVGVIRAGLS
jgi:repressor LexA